MARLLLLALRGAGFDPILASELRSLDLAGDPDRQNAIRVASEAEADRLVAHFRQLPHQKRPRLWFTYHCHYKAPDWIGPRVSEALGIGYVVAEGSRSARRAHGLWAIGHQGAEAAIAFADRLFVMTPRDAEDIEPALRPGQRLTPLPPFLDLAAWKIPEGSRRAGSPTRLLTVAMMREGDKLASYRILADALACLPDDADWKLDIVGDGPAREEIRTKFSIFGKQVRFLGALHDRTELAAAYASADLLVWPAVGEAYGMTLLEAQACGCPILAGREGGVAAVLREGETGILAPRRDAKAFAAALADLIAEPERLSRMGELARRFIHRERGLRETTETLRETLSPLAGYPIVRSGRVKGLRVLIAVTHLVGAGHLMRASAIGRALARRGHHVTLVSGGMPMALADTDGMDLVQLPPVRSPIESYSTLLDPDGERASALYLDRRRQELLSTFARVAPHVVITEQFPFGRRSLAAEFQALLDAVSAARHCPILLGSVRDILVAPDKKEKIERAHSLVAHRYQAILVHGEREIIPLDLSWPVDEALRRKLIYTGYVGSAADPQAPSFETGAGEIVVSGGSSASGLPLYRTAIAAAEFSQDRTWRVLVGPAVDGATFEQLVLSAPPNAVVERARRDFRTLLTSAAVFVGQAGYNTVMDIAATRVRSVLVPFEQGQETEQRLRAEGLAARGLATLLPQSDLSPDTLLTAIKRTEAGPRPDFVFSAVGQDRSAVIVEELMVRVLTGMPDGGASQ